MPMKPETRRKWKKRVTAEKRAWIQEYKRLQGCSICKEDDPVCLDLHHFEDNKRETVSQLVSGNYTIATIRKEVKKCIVVCANCHRKITAKSK